MKTDFKEFTWEEFTDILSKPSYIFRCRTALDSTIRTYDNKDMLRNDADHRIRFINGGYWDYIFEKSSINISNISMVFLGPLRDSLIPKKVESLKMILMVIVNQ